jgi:hypothetical protein
MQRLGFVLVAAGSAGLAFLAGCGKDSPTRVANRSPMVVIKGGPLNQSVASYTARILWSGWDEDGMVTHYEYAIDPPEVFSNWEIANPERFPGIAITVLPGPAQDEDTLVVSKVVDGKTASFRWVETHEFSRSFTFQTPNPDSEFVNGNIEPADHFSGAHTVYVRCQDNEGAYSDADPSTKGDTLEADFVGYTAVTQTPSSEILQPKIKQDVLNLAPTLLVTWDGLDPDSPEAGKKPKGFVYKILRLDTLEPPVYVVNAAPSLLYSRGGPWIYQSGDSLTLNLQLPVLGQFLFGVRAVDVAGAMEPKLDLGRNAFRFQALPTSSKPFLTIRESSIGSLKFYGLGPPKEAEVPANKDLDFIWSARSEDYGEVKEFSWGIDIPDLSVEGPESGWSVWGDIHGPPRPINFPNAGTHVLYVRARDIAGNLTLAQLILRVIEFTFEREVLLVDDTLDDTFPNDNEHDAFWRDMVSSYALNSDIPAEQFFTTDVANQTPLPPTLSELSRYKLVIWENLGSGYNANSALVQATALSPRLSAYLGAGGKLWLGGRMTVGATIAAPNASEADLDYPKTELGPGDWAWDFLKLHSTRIMNDKGGSNRNRMHSVWPFPGVAAVYDSMVVDPAKLTLLQQASGGFAYADAVFDPIYAEAEEGFRGDIDSLYAYGASGVEVLGTTSSYEGRLCALRWHDPDPAREHGRIQWFGFALYFMRNDQAARTFKKSVDWFREEIPSQP